MTRLPLLGRPLLGLVATSLFALAACEGGRDSTGTVARDETPGPLTGCSLAPVAADDGLGALREAGDVLPVLSYPIPRGGLYECTPRPGRASPKTVDGDPADWVGQATRLGGTTRLDAGELIHSDFLHDAYGADDGGDAQRLALLDPLAAIDARLSRFDALMQAAGDQFGAPPPVGALDHYGNAVDLDAEADLYELRFAADEEAVYLLARWTALTNPDNAQLLLLLGDPTAEPAGGEVGFDTGLTSVRSQFAILLSARQVLIRDLRSGAERVLDGARVAARAQGWTNALEASLPAALFSDITFVSAISLASTDAGLVPANVMYRDSEPVTIYNDKLQALTLGLGTADLFGYPLNLAALRSGRSMPVLPGPGYHERQFASGDNISREGGENGRWQPYGLYLPPDYLATSPELTPLDIWLHYRGGKAHSGAAWTPRLIQQLGAEPGHVVVTPRGRGTSTWYVTQAHQDVFEVLADVQTLLPNLDPQRRYLSGYSMGGYGTYLFGLLYPDQFAAGFSSSGAVTQGAWTGLGPDGFPCDQPGGEIPGVGSASSPCFVEANEGRANAQLNYRLLENARHFPLTIHHGSNDELALTPGALRMAERLLTLGYRHDATTFLGYEHFTQAIVDEWADGVAYLHQFVTPTQPRTITYKRLPALLEALNTVRAGEVEFDFNPDGAWWVDALRVRDPDPADPEQFGLIEAVSEALPAATSLPIPRSVEVRPEEPAVSTPVLSIGAHSTPYVRTGLDWLDIGEEPLANAFTVTLTGLAAATLDVAGMGLDGAQPMSGRIVSDGASELRLRRLPAGVVLEVEGAELEQSDDEARIVLQAGEATLRW